MRKLSTSSLTFSVASNCFWPWRVASCRAFSLVFPAVLLMAIFLSGCFASAGSGAKGAPTPIAYERNLADEWDDRADHLDAIKGRFDELKGDWIPADGAGEFVAYMKRGVPRVVHGDIVSAKNRQVDHKSVLRSPRATLSLRG